MTVPRHAVEITLVRPAQEAELVRAGRRLRIAADADRTRLMTVVRAATPHSALTRARRRIGDRLPVDVLTTHYPDTDGTVLLRVDVPHTVDDRIRRLAALSDQTPGEFLAEAVTAAAARDQEQRVHRMQPTLAPLLEQHTPQEILLAVARALTVHRPGRPPAGHHKVED